MGGSLYRKTSFRKPIKFLASKFLLWPLLPVLGFLIAFGLSSFDERSKKPPIDNLSDAVVRPLEAVAALGQLSPLGEIRKLAAPSSGFGGTPRIAELLIREGDLVKEGQVLAVFDNRPKIIADLQGVRARIETLRTKIRIQKRQISRYQIAANEGAASLVLLEDNQDELVRLEGEKEIAKAELRGLESDLDDSELKTPIDGVVLRINAREGERPGVDGVLEVGANQSMEALIEVYESDINRVKIGQAVVLTSENGGFSGNLEGRVKRISPQVSQRRVLSTDPTGDADARIVEVRVVLDSASARRVSKLTGMKVIARFQLL